MNLYKRDTRSGQEATGLHLVPKLNIYLSSFSKMRVDLAAQVGIIYMYSITIIM